MFFLALEGLLYACFISCDLFFPAAMISSFFKYSSILLCFFMSLYLFLRQEKSLDRFLVCFAMLFTAIADIFLMFTGHFIYGVAAFFIVQTIYLIRCLCLKHKMGTFLFHLILRCGISLVISFILYFSSVTMDALLIVTVLYIVSFACNLFVVAGLLPRQHDLPDTVSILLFLVGMCLFFLCDIQVGLNNLASYVSLTAATKSIIYSIVGIGMWACYLPGQVFIVLSGSKSRK